jgi:hypothetical protein
MINFNHNNNYNHNLNNQIFSVILEEGESQNPIKAQSILPRKNSIKKRTSIKNPEDKLNNITFTLGLNSFNNNNNNQIIISNSKNIYNNILNGDWTNLNFLNNKYKYIIKTTRYHPEKNQMGILILDKNSDLKFIALLNNPRKKIKKFNLNEIKFVIIFRYLYKYKGLNIFLEKGKRSIIFLFETEKETKEIYNYLIENSPKFDTMRYDIKKYMNLWVEGYISNFDYLIYLNEMAGRSFNDLSQYPVMPWIIKNYSDIDCKLIN